MVRKIRLYIFFIDIPSNTSRFPNPVSPTQLPPPQSNNVYREKYKGIALCLGMLSTALAGTYVNFGVFTLYNDKVRRHV